MVRKKGNKVGVDGVDGKVCRVQHVLIFLDDGQLPGVRAVVTLHEVTMTL